MRIAATIVLTCTLCGCVTAPKSTESPVQWSQSDLRSSFQFLLGLVDPLPESVVVEECDGEFLIDTSSGENYHEACAATLAPTDFAALFGRSPIDRTPLLTAVGPFHGISVGPQVQYSDLYVARWYHAEVYTVPDKSRVVVYARSIVEVFPK